MTFTPGSSQPLPSGPYDPTPIDYTGVAPPPDRPKPTDLGVPAEATTNPDVILTAATTHANGAPAAPPKPVFWTYEQAQKEGRMEPTFDGKVNALLALAKKQGVVLWLGSGFRDNAKQTSLYAKGIADHGADQVDNWVAHPADATHKGSNHERGEAADIFGDQGWLAQHAPQFGLVQPMAWESWHWEPAGLRGQSDPAAYTKGPPGSLNPTVDTQIDSSPAEIMAATANLFGSTPAGVTDPGASIAHAVTGGLTDFTGQVPGATIPGTPSVPASSTRTGSVAAPGDIGAENVTVPTAPASYVPPAATGAVGPSGGPAIEGVNRHQRGAVPEQPSATQAEFVSKIVPYAEREAARTGVPAAVMIVQSALETGWGTSGWWKNDRNPAGIGVTGEPGKGYSYATLDEAFRDYADHLSGHGEMGQEDFLAALAAGKPVETLLTILQHSPWAEGKYGGGTTMVDTYHALQASGMIAPNEAASSTPPASAPPERPVPDTVRPAAPAAPTPKPRPTGPTGRGSKRHI